MLDFVPSAKRGMGKGLAMSGGSERVAGEVRAVRASDGAALEYEVLGEGPPLVMLHGFISGRFTFSRQRRELAGHYRLIMVSARGHDGSDGRLPTNYGAGTSDVDDLLAVLDAEGLDRLRLLGHSSGGATGFVFGRLYPERVVRAVLIEPTLYPVLPPVDLVPVIEMMNKIAAAAESEGAEAALRIMLDLIAGEAWHSLDAETKEQRLKGMARIAPLVAPHVRGLCDLMVRDEDIRGLRPPTLLFYGAESFPFERVIADRFRALRPDLRIIFADKAGHNVHRDRADLVNAELMSFLAA